MLAGLGRVFARTRVSESRATNDRGDPELQGSFLGVGDTEFLFSPVLEIGFAVRLLLYDEFHIIVTDWTSSFSSPRFDLSALLMLPLAPDSLSLRAVGVLFDPLDLASLDACLPLPLPVRRSTTRAFSGYRGVLGPSLFLDIPAIWWFIFISESRFFSPVEWNTCVWGVWIRPSLVRPVRKTEQSHRRISYKVVVHARTGYCCRV